MFATKGWLIATFLAVLFVLAGATLFLTGEVFAKDDRSPHGNNSHIHTTDTGKDNVDWIVKVGRLEWNGFSTYCWHSVYARNNKGSYASGEWEWKHHVRNKDNTWSKTDKIWKRDITLAACQSLWQPPYTAEALLFSTIREKTGPLCKSIGMATGEYSLGTKTAIASSRAVLLLFR